jgi:pyruvate kinase
MIKLPAKKTKIVATIGPATQPRPVLEQLIAAGMNIARINFAHGRLQDHRQTIANIRAAAAAQGQRVAIFGDLPGPKMRIGKLAEEPIMLERGDPFVLQTAEMVGNRQRVSLDFAGLTAVVQPGDYIFINDGYIQLIVERVDAGEVACRVHVGGELRSHKGVNFPGIDLGIRAFTEQDRALLAFAAEEQLDGVSQSFVLGADDVTAVREAAAALHYEPFIIAKVERAGALAHLQEIIRAADGVMVARGDLGVEIPIEEVPAVQKEIIRACNLLGKPVITATQMLESMTNNRRPTRAEATDVANAILDGTDCVMLSGETAVGQYPVDTVTTMSHIAEKTEATMGKFGVADLLKLAQGAGKIDRDDLISLVAFLTAEMLRPNIVFVPSCSGETARLLTRFRLPQWIIASTLEPKTCQDLQFSYGVFPVYASDEPALLDSTSRRAYAAQWLREQAGGGAKTALMVEGAGTLHEAVTKRIDIITIED